MYALVLALVAALGLWVMGGYKAENNGSIEIKATPEQVFEVLVEPDQREKWLQNATRVEMNSDPPLGPKTTYTTQQSVEGKNLASEDSVQQIKRPEWISIRMDSVSSTLITMFELSRVGDQTKLSYRASQAPNSYYRFLAPFKKLDLQGRIDEELVKIKRQSEELAAKAPPEVKAGENPNSPVESPNEEKSPATGEEASQGSESSTEPSKEPGPEKKDG